MDTIQIVSTKRSWIDNKVMIPIEDTLAKENDTSTTNISYKKPLQDYDFETSNPQIYKSLKRSMIKDSKNRELKIFN